MKTIKVSDEFYEQLTAVRDMLATIDKENEVKKYARPRRRTPNVEA